MSPTARPPDRGVVDVAAAADPVGAVLDAHHHGRLIALRTSGTTSRPRSVVRTTASWVDSFPAVSALAGVHPGSRFWVPGPLSATMNLFAAVHAHSVGASLVASTEQATHAHLTPAALVAALAAGTDLSGRTLVVAGDRLPRRVRDRAAGAGARVHHYYGAAELSFVAWGSCEDDLRLFPGVQARVREGRLWVRSPYLSLGHDGAGGPFEQDGDGFATVGDRGSLTGDALTVFGRGNQAVVTGGVTVLVDDVEAVLRRATGADVVVLGAPHPRLGAVVTAVLPDPALLPAARAAARAGLPAAHRPRRWLHLAGPPVTAAGKVDRAALAALVAAGRAPSAARR
ncbi:AMP-binding protein [Geodermatophilus sp. DSM 44513]|uniref:AMP-binding protein n=1 Tax=Geodermatophilus sp. DSM 44513 TaxID=1528104 RepID=UPI001412ACDF|nr:AMP-binding protein [Geodermatophilus sp. DSM 44513]WNV76890.1 AMP-binding protein [Geodermatophilus sp. DSM 44513]